MPVIFFLLLLFAFAVCVFSSSSVRLSFLPSLLLSLCLSILLAAFVVVVVNSTHPLSGMVFCGSNVASSGHMRRFFCKPPLSSFGVSHWQTLESLRLFLLIITGEEREREREREREKM